jgi:hypothetical protein
MKVISALIIAILLIFAIENKPATAASGVPKVYFTYDSHLPDNLLNQLRKFSMKKHSNGYQLSDEKDCDIVMNTTLVSVDNEQLYLSITLVNLNKHKTSKKAGITPINNYERIFYSAMEPELLKFIKDNK